MLRPCYAEIDLSAIAHNVKEFKKITPQGSHLMAVVKADGYGHGAVPVLNKAVEAGVTWAGVALVEEAIQLREAGFSLPILLLSGLFPQALPYLPEYDITPVAYSPGCLSLLFGLAQKQNKPLKIHLKLDTGMGRLGLSLRQYQDFLKGPKGLLEVEGLMTHFAAAEERDKGSALAQSQRFAQWRGLGKGKINPQWIHLANSAGTSEMEPQGANLFRLGIALYGQQPSTEPRQPVNLKPALTLKASIMQLQWYPAGARLGYGGSFQTSRRSLIAAVGVGYADGLPRLLSNRGRVLLRGVFCPIVGRVSMDITLVDVTAIKGVEVFEVVTLIGSEGSEEITAGEVAQQAGTINYEITCGLSKRVPRIYKNE